MDKTIDMFADMTKKMQPDKGLTKHIGIRVYNTKSFEKFFETVTKTKKDAYQVAYQYRHRKQVQVAYMPDGNCLIRVSNEALPMGVQGGVWNPHKSIILNKE